MNRKHLSLLVVVLALVLIVCLGSSVEAGRPKIDFWLTILHNNDGESALINLGGTLEDFGGAARFKTLVDDLKWEATHGPRGRGNDRYDGFTPGAKRGVILVSSGDNFLAGPQFNASLQKGVPFYDTIAMDLFDYDAVDIGNHDFDFGPDVLADFIEGYQFNPPPYLSANLDFSAEPRLQYLVDQGRIAASVVVKERGELIGIIGATTPAITYISSPRNVIVDEDVAGAVQEQVDYLEGMGVNKIILISHLQDIDGDIALASELEGIDVMVAGGGDEVLANPGDLLIPGDETEIHGSYPMVATDMNGTQIPVVTTAGSYSYVGQLVVAFDKEGNIVAINDNKSGPKRVAGGDYPDAVESDPLVQALVTDPVQAYVDSLDANVIATSAEDLDGRRSSVRSMEANEGNLIADSLLWQATQLAADFGVAVPDVALQNGGGIRNDSIIPAGDITELDTYSMAPFGNFLTAVENIPRAQFKEILENAVSRTQAGDMPGGTGRFAQVAGFTFTYSAGGTAQVLNEDGTVSTAGTRVQEVTLDDGTHLVTGGAVVSGTDITVATIDFLARGGDEYPYRDAPFVVMGTSYQQALYNYIVEGLGGVIDGPDYAFGVNLRIFEIP